MAELLGDVDRFLGFDLETTGLDIATARILTSSLVEYHDGHFNPFTAIINPGIPVPESSTAIHGMTTEYIQEYGVDPASAIEEVGRQIDAAWDQGVPVVGHNVSYDLGVLKAEMARYDLPPLKVHGPVIDTMVLHRMAGNKKATLAVTAASYGVVNESAHSSEADTIATLKVLNAMLQRSQALRKTDLRSLFVQQRDFHYTWARDLESYFHRIGKYDPVNGQWPVQEAN